MNAPTPLRFSESAACERASTMPMAAHYDVVVVGARAAGAATAMLLARRGLRVLAVDRSAYGSDTLSTHSLARTGVLQLSRWGVLDRIRAAGTPVARAVRFHYGGEPIVLQMASAGDVDGLYSPRRTVLDAALVDEARRSGADVRHGVSVAGLRRDPTGRVCGVDIDVEGVRCAVDATWVVGADGVRSRVAREVGADLVREEAACATVLYGYWTGVADDVIDNVFDVRGAAAGVIPTNDGQACVWVAGRPERLRSSMRGDLRGTYHAAIGASGAVARSLAGATCVGGYRGFAGIPGFLRRAFGPGWALVGDAGYFKDPVSAHGITDAFIGAELLADALAGACATSDDTPLARYEERRDALAAELMPPVAALASLELDPAGARAEFKRLSHALHSEWEFVEARAPIAA